MKCPQEGCKVKVKSDTDYSIHMNLVHRGCEYKPLYEGSDKDKKETKEYNGKTDVYDKLAK